MAEYKDTLNLPNTSFPMKASLSVREPEMLADWQAKGIYQKIRKARVGSKRFILHDGRPMPTGISTVGMRSIKFSKILLLNQKPLVVLMPPLSPVGIVMACL